MVASPCGVDRQDGGAVALSGDFEKFVECLGACVRAKAERARTQAARSALAKCCQGAGDKAAEYVPDYDGTQTALRPSERDDSTKARGRQDRRRHIGVSE